jgi:hypothetical protein
MKVSHSAGEGRKRKLSGCVVEHARDVGIDEHETAFRSGRAEEHCGGDSLRAASRLHVRDRGFREGS